MKNQGRVLFICFVLGCLTNTAFSQEKRVNTNNRVNNNTKGDKPKVKSQQPTYEEYIEYTDSKVESNRQKVQSIDKSTNPSNEATAVPTKNESSSEVIYSISEDNTVDASKTISIEEKAKMQLNTKQTPPSFPKYNSSMSSKEYEEKVYQWFLINPSFRKNNSSN